MKNLSKFALLALMVAPCAAQTAALPAGFEDPAILSASKILSPDLLKGAHHRVREQVPTDGYLAHFEIDTDFGTFAAIGIPQVASRITETEAIAKLVETSKSDLFAEGLKRSIEQPIDAVKNIAQDPVGSIKKVPATVGHFFGKVGASIERGANKVANNRKSEDKPSAGETAGKVGNTAMNIAGFDKARLETARELGIDPYTDNVRLQSEIDKVTWAFFAGGLPLRITATVASAGIALTATKMVGIPEEIYSLTQGEIADLDRKALTAMGLRNNDIIDFQNAPALSTTRRHKIVNSLAALPNAEHRGNIILLATDCQTGQAADFLVAALRILESRQSSGAADYTAVKVVGRLPAAVTAEGTLEVPAPVDHVTWTEAVAGFASRDDLGTQPKTLLHTGTFSKTASAGFTGAGWKLTPFGNR